MKIQKILMAGAVALATLSAPVVAQMDKVQIKAQKLTDKVYVLFGAGGNIGLHMGTDGVYLIDDQYAPMSAKILAKVKELSGKAPKYVINTHFHGDHSGGNENLGKAGGVIIAHDNVRVRLSKPSFVKAFNMRSDAYPKGALPVITFSDHMSLHLNGDEARLHHIKHAHTDGDSIVHFKKSNVIHMGDTFFNGMYPFIDVPNGGNVNGVIKAVETAIGLSNDTTQIIPGHGPVTNKAGAQAYLKMLTTARDRIGTLKSKGKTLDQVKAALPLADYDAKIKGGRKGWNLMFIQFVYNSL